MSTTISATDICALDDLVVGVPAGALLDGVQIALVRWDAHTVYAVANFDPFSEAMVMARGIVGDVQGAPMLASPIYKQRFDLRSGACFDDPGVSLPVFPVVIVAGRVQVQIP